MVHDVLDAEERRRVSLALSVRHETKARFRELRRELRLLIVGVFRADQARSHDRGNRVLNTVISTRNDK